MRRAIRDEPKFRLMNQDDKFRLTQLDAKGFISLIQYLTKST